MNAQGRKWKDTLDKGQALILKMSGKRLEPSLADGDAATVKRTPPADLVVDDIILCEVRNKCALHMITNIRMQNGVRIFEVQDKGQTYSFPEAGVLGKMVSSRRRSHLQEERGVLGFLKRIFFSG